MFEINEFAAPEVEIIRTLTAHLTPTKYRVAAKRLPASQQPFDGIEIIVRNNGGRELNASTLADIGISVTLYGNDKHTFSELETATLETVRECKRLPFRGGKIKAVRDISARAVEPPDGRETRSITFTARFRAEKTTRLGE